MPAVNVGGTLRRAEAFVAGFEDDPLQEGVPDLLAGLRALREALDRIAEIAVAPDGTLLGVCEVLEDAGLLPLEKDLS